MKTMKTKTIAPRTGLKRKVVRGRLKHGGASVDPFEENLCEGIRLCECPNCGDKNVIAPHPDTDYKHCDECRKAFESEDECKWWEMETTLDPFDQFAAMMYASNRNTDIF